jgi:hypothetical protein
VDTGGRGQVQFTHLPTGGDCVEVADLGLPGVAVRDPKDPEAGILTASPEAYSRLKDWVTSAAKS